MHPCHVGHTHAKRRLGSVRTCTHVAELDRVQPLTTLDVPGFRLRETVYAAAAIVPRQPHTWATLCLAIEGGYQVDWGSSGLRCGPASLVFRPPGQVYGARISDEGSRCLTVEIDPAELMNAADALPDFEHLRGAPHTAPLAGVPIAPGA
jgi:hypothetical protein